MGFPKFKSRKRSKQSFRVEGYSIDILKLGWVNMAEELRFEGKILETVVSKTADWWFVSITVQIEKPEPIMHPVEAVGIDLDVKILATLSDEVSLTNERRSQQQ